MSVNIHFFLIMWFVCMYAVHSEENTVYVPLICQYVGTDESLNALIHAYIRAIVFYLCASCMVDI